MAIQFRVQNAANYEIEITCNLHYLNYFAGSSFTAMPYMHVGNGRPGIIVHKGAIVDLGGWLYMAQTYRDVALALGTSVDFYRELFAGNLVLLDW
jgi:hypothetical protein